MEPIQKFSGRMVALPINDIDTDQIIPARYLKVTDKNGLGSACFSDWRYEADGSPKQDFPLNQPQYQGAAVLIGGHNFGGHSIGCIHRSGIPFSNFNQTVYSTQYIGYL